MLSARRGAAQPWPGECQGPTPYLGTLNWAARPARLCAFCAQTSWISVDTKPSALAAQSKSFHCHFDFSRRVYKTVPLRRGLEMSPCSGPATHQNVENADAMFEGIRMLLVNRIA